MEVFLADQAGACYGVNRALKLAMEASDRPDGKPVHTLGPLIHNPKVVSELEERGIHEAESPEDALGGVLVIRTHGVPKGVMPAAEGMGIEVVDATCPHVQRAQEEAARLAAEGRYVLIFGEPGHPEVEGILSYAGERAKVVEGIDDVPDLPVDTPVGVVVQTTQRNEKLRVLVGELEKRFADLEVCDTICAATGLRQSAALRLASKVDAMVVIGGRNSGNTKRLYEICSEACSRTVLIEAPSELEQGFFSGCGTVGVTAGASTPQSHIDAVVEVLSGF